MLCLSHSRINVVLQITCCQKKMFRYIVEYFTCITLTQHSLLVLWSQLEKLITKYHAIHLPSSHLFSDIPECDSSPCLMYSTCMDVNNGYRCECVPGYTGVLCDERKHN